MARRALCAIIRSFSKDFSDRRGHVTRLLCPRIFAPAFLARKFLAPAFLLALGLASPAQAQFAPSCESANGFSLGAAQSLIRQADAIIIQAPDCSQVNLMLCQDAEQLYLAAARHVGEVYFNAKGEACSYCDLGQVGALAQLLASREQYFRTSLFYDVNFSDVWRDWPNWRDAPICSAPAQQPPPIVGNPVSLCASSGGYPASRLNARAGLTMTGVPYQNECEGRCDQNDWCRSFDFDFNNGICTLFDRTKEEVGLLPAPDGYAHFVCQGR